MAEFKKKNKTRKRKKNGEEEEEEEVVREGWRKGKQASKRSRKRTQRRRAGQATSSQPLAGGCCLWPASLRLAPASGLQLLLPAGFLCSLCSAVQPGVAGLAAFIFYAEGREVRKSKCWPNPRATSRKPGYGDGPHARVGNGYEAEVPSFGTPRCPATGLQ